jgi:phage terminase large subunit-like protein
MDFTKLDEVTNHAGFKYMTDILEGRITCGRFTTWMCQRQLGDLQHGSERGLYFSTDHADIFLDTVRTYKHYKGSRFAGKYFEPTPPQIFFNWCLFGWLKEGTMTRRFTEVYKEVARKNGKTFEGASTGKYMFSDDGEPGANCYTVATKKDQAKLAHEDAKAIIRELQKDGEDIGIKILRDNISELSTYSKWSPLGRDSKSEDGLNPHFALLDEVHAMADSSMYDVIDSAFGGREQPLLYLITTAGFNPQGPGYKIRGYLKKILDPDIDIQNDNIFGAIYTLDMKIDGAREDDDIWDEGNWEKANPNMPYIPTILPKLRSMALKAHESETIKANFMTKHLNIWLSSSAPWIRPEDWALNDGCFGDRDLINQKCYSGLDLASVNDLASLVHIFPPKGKSISAQRTGFRKEIISEIQYAHSDIAPEKMHLLLDDFENRIERDLRKMGYVDPGPYKIMPHFFVPEMNIEKRSKAHGVRYDLWAKDTSCNFHATPGRTVDYSFIEYQVDKDSARYNMIELGYDPHNAHSLITNLVNKEIECVEIVQNWGNMSWVSKEFENLILMAALAHRNNPVLAWNAQNVVVHMGPSGNYKPDKQKSPEKIDGIIALLMALNRAISNEAENDDSIYETRGALVL